MTGEPDFNQHLDVFNITTQLASSDVKIEKGTKALLLLVSLPSSFDYCD